MFLSQVPVSSMCLSPCLFTSVSPFHFLCHCQSVSSTSRCCMYLTKIFLFFRWVQGAIVRWWRLTTCSWIVRDREGWGNRLGQEGTRSQVTTSHFLSLLFLCHLCDYVALRLTGSATYVNTKNIHVFFFNQSKHHWLQATVMLGWNWYTKKVYLHILQKRLSKSIEN